MTGCRGQQQLGQRVDQPGQHHLGLGVAEARVELDDLHAGVGEDEAGVEQADERRALGVELADDGLGHLAGDEVDELLLAAELRAEPRERRVGAHAAGVGAGVAVEQALVVLGGAERQHVVAVAEEEERDLGSGEELLDEHRAERQVLVGVGDRGGAVVGDDDALARGEAVGLDDVAERRGRRARPRARRGWRRARRGRWARPRRP